MEMQLPHEQRLVVLSVNSLRQLERQLVPLMQAYEQAVNAHTNGGPAVPNNVKLPYEAKLREVEAELNHAIDQVEANCAIHEAYVQRLLNVGKNNVALLKKYTDAYNTNPTPELAQTIADAARQAVPVMNQLGQDVKAADNLYGQAWWEFRENPVHQDVDHVVKKDYYHTKRMSLMGRGKLITAKIAKCQQLTVQAQAYQTMSVKLLKDAQGQKTKSKEVEKTVLNLTVKLEDMLDKGMINAPKMGWQVDGHAWQNKLSQLTKTAHEPITAKTQALATSYYKDVEAATKNFKNQLKTMDTLVTTTKRALTGKELNKNIKLMQKADQIVAKARHVVADAEKIKAACLVQLTAIMHHHV